MDKELDIDEIARAAELEDEEKSLLILFRSLHYKLRSYTKAQFNRINPATEDFFSWKEKGAYWTCPDKDITIYNSTTLSGDVDVGNHTWIGPFCSLDGSGGLTIGSYCSISTGCQIVSHDTVKWALSGGEHEYEYAPTAIGDRCFIGSHAVITKGVTIGECCVIGAGAVVTKDVPAYSIVSGVPGLVIGKVLIKDSQNIELIYHKE